MVIMERITKMVTAERYNEIVRLIEEIRQDGFVVAYLPIKDLNYCNDWDFEEVEELMVKVALDNYS